MPDPKKGPKYNPVKDPMLVKAAEKLEYVVMAVLASGIGMMKAKRISDGKTVVAFGVLHPDGKPPKGVPAMIPMGEITLGNGFDAYDPIPNPDTGRCEVFGFTKDSVGLSALLKAAPANAPPPLVAALLAALEGKTPRPDEPPASEISSLLTRVKAEIDPKDKDPVSSCTGCDKSLPFSELDPDSGLCSDCNRNSKGAS